jgi:hypothetical protein
MKEYFAYKTGSYWIYKNDSTGSFDSAYIVSYDDGYDNSISGVKREGITMFFNSKYLTAVEIGYFICSGPNYLTVSSIMHNLPPGQQPETEQIPAFCDSWSPNSIITPNCYQECYRYTNLQTITINSMSYNNILDTKLQTYDSTLTNPNYYFRRILFAKNVGIIKYIEIAKYFNIQRSYSLLRYKIVQ